MTEQDFMANLGNIKALCAPERSASMNQIAKENAPRSKNAVGPLNESAGATPGEFYDYGEKWEKMFLGETASAPAAATSDAAPVISTRAAQKSRVPDFIKNSMLSENIDTTALHPNPLERMDFSKFQNTQQLNEQAPVMPTPQAVAAPVAPAASGIDYPLLRAIISECIDSKFKELGITKELLSENTLKTIHLKGGQIKLVDNKGNVFGASLEMQGNINDKKK